MLATGLLPRYFVTKPLLDTSHILYLAIYIMNGFRIVGATVIMGKRPKNHQIFEIMLIQGLGSPKMVFLVVFFPKSDSPGRKRYHIEEILTIITKSCHKEYSYAWEGLSWAWDGF